MVPAASSAAPASAGAANGGSNSGSTQLRLVTLTGRSIFVRYDPCDTVESVKHKVQDKAGIHVHKQRLIFKGVKLEDEWGLAERGIAGGMTLHLVLRLRGERKGKSKKRRQQGESSKPLPCLVLYKLKQTLYIDVRLLAVPQLTPTIYPSHTTITVVVGVFCVGKEKRDVQKSGITPSVSTKSIDETLTCIHI